MVKRSIWFGAGFSLMLAMGVVLAKRGEDALELQVESSSAAPAMQDTISGSRRNAIVVASQRVAPAVVSVNVVRQSRQPRTMWESLFFPETNRRDDGLGSGFIIREDGLVLTNEHVELTVGLHLRRP